MENIYNKSWNAEKAAADANKRLSDLQWYKIFKTKSNVFKIAHEMKKVFISMTFSACLTIAWEAYRATGR